MIKKTIIFLTTNLLIVIGFVNSNAQIKVALRLDESAKSIAAKILFCDENYDCGLKQNENSKISKVDGLEIPIKVWRTDKNFYFLIDTNRNNKLTDEKKVLLVNGLQAKIRIKKKTSSGKILFLPFEISHQIYEKDGLITDIFKILPHYVAAGTLRYKNCSSKISFSDMNFDGRFTLSDAEGGTNLKIDQNNDEKFWGKEEYKKTDEIIEFCGQNFLASSLDNTNLTLVPTDLQLATIGEVVPKFSFVLLNGETISSDSLAGKNYVLDFWASWCVPCVENLPQIKRLKTEFENKLAVLSINVDELSGKDAVRRIIEKYRIFDFSVIRGLGNEDPLWKTFGGANQNRLAIPLYVLVDKNGIVRYAADGGTQLRELRQRLSELETN